MTPTPSRNLRVSDEEWARWEHSARAAGLSVSEWIRAMCTSTPVVTDESVEGERSDHVTGVAADIGPCAHPKSARDPKGYATFCAKDKGGCGARL